jgi:ABC-type transport system substrate-binding protein
MKVAIALMSVAILAGMLGVTASLVTSSFAAAPKNGWGLVTSQEATSEHDVGTHASNPDPTNTDPHDTPRSGIGNVADTFTGTKNPSELGCLLASIDSNSATGC